MTATARVAFQNICFPHPIEIGRDRYLNNIVLYFLTHCFTYLPYYIGDLHVSVTSAAIVVTEISELLIEGNSHPYYSRKFHIHSRRH